jgi:hypothetical protein
MAGYVRYMHNSLMSESTRLSYFLTESLQQIFSSTLVGQALSVHLQSVIQSS